MYIIIIKIIRIILYLLIEVAFLFACSIETLNAVTEFYVSPTCSSESQLKLRLFPRCVPLNIATKHCTNRTARYTYTVKRLPFPSIYILHVLDFRPNFVEYLIDFGMDESELSKQKNTARNQQSIESNLIS